MKKIFLALMVSIFTVFGAVAQADLTPLVVVKLNKSETITLKHLKNRVALYQKQGNVTSFSVDTKKEILKALVDEKLILQAAQKSGITVPDSLIEQQFLGILQQNAGRAITEKEFDALLQAQTKQTLDEYMKQSVGMTVSEYKTQLKNSYISQQYVIQKKGEDIKKVAATDEEIRSYYELYKTNFVRPDTMKLFLVIVPKGEDAAAAKSKAEALYKQIKDKSVTFDTLKANSVKEKTFSAGDMIVGKTPIAAQQLGLTSGELNELFGYEIGHVSDKLNETTFDFQFYVVREKFAAKMLELSDVVQPGSTVTVYDYCKGNVTGQKQQAALAAGLKEIVNSLDSPSNVNWKKEGEALDNLLNW